MSCFSRIPVTSEGDRTKLNVPSNCEKGSEQFVRAAMTAPRISRPSRLINYARHKRTTITSRHVRGTMPLSHRSYNNHTLFGRLSLGSALTHASGPRAFGKHRKRRETKRRRIGPRYYREYATTSSSRGPEKIRPR